MFDIPKQFRLIDLLLFTGMLAILLAAFLAQIRTPFAAWTIAIYLTPTAFAGLLQFRFRLPIIPAVAVHYFTTIIWIFLHSIGRSAALNAHFAAIPNSSRRMGDSAICSTAWNDTVVALLLWTPLLAICYGTICYAVIRAYKWTLLAKMAPDLTTGE